MLSVGGLWVELTFGCLKGDLRANEMLFWSCHRPWPSSWAVAEQLAACGLRYAVCGSRSAADWLPQ